MNTTAEKKAILVVSFGTSYENTRKITIDAIERAVGDAFPDYRIYRAWTSKMIIARLKKRDGITIPGVTEAMEQMADDGITHVVVQPTHVINGTENDIMKEQALAFQDRFQQISFGAPLLSSERDREEVVRVIAGAFPDLSPDTVLVLMGHGTEHPVNPVYSTLSDTFREMGYPRILLGTVEADPDLQRVLDMVKALAPKKVILAPFMIVAGDHANNDMAGDDENSWTSRLKKEGYEAAPLLKGLGEYPGIRSIFLRHVREAIQSL